MICIFKTRKPVVASLVRDWLVRNDIAARAERTRVFVPVVDETRAKDLLRHFHGPILVHPAWECGCGEVNEANFGSCWSCGADRPDVAALLRAG